jgi:hypothetical protein
VVLVNTKRFLGKAGVAVAIGGLLGAGTAAGFGVASAASSPTTAAFAPSGSTTQPKAGNHPGLRRLLAKRVEHGEFTIKGKDGKPAVVDVQRGQVTAVSATSITLKSEDGFTASYAVSADTKVRVGGAQKAMGDVKVGNNAGVVAKKDGSTVTAAAVVVK